MVELAEFACNDVGGGTVPINERVTSVASAMAEAVAEVVGQCSGEGNAQATVSGLSRAETRAEAVGTASAQIVATSQVCEFCSSGLEAFSTAVETVAASAVAEARIMVCRRYGTLSRLGLKADIGHSCTKKHLGSFTTCM